MHLNSRYPFGNKDLKDASPSCATGHVRQIGVRFSLVCQARLSKGQSVSLPLLTVQRESGSLRDSQQMLPCFPGGIGQPVHSTAVWTAPEFLFSFSLVTFDKEPFVPQHLLISWELKLEMGVEATEATRPFSPTRKGRQGACPTLEGPSPLGDQKGTGLSPGGWRGPRSSDMGHGPPPTDAWSV